MMTASFRKPAGFSLVELMVALAVGMIIILVVAQFFVATRGSYLQGDASSRIQESGRFGMDVLSSDIRMAGYMGCNSNTDKMEISNIAEPAGNNFFKFNEAVRGYIQGSGTVPAGLTAWSEVKAGTSVLAIQRADSTSTRLTGNMTANNANIQIKGNPAAIQDDEVLMITDCVAADVFRANNVSHNGVIVPATTTVTIAHPNSVNTQSHLNRVYGANSEVMRLISRLYYIGSGTGTCPLNTLCRVNAGVASGSPAAQVETLVSNVEDMDILYGEDTDYEPSTVAGDKEPRDGGDMVPDRFVASGSVTNWRAVVAVQVNMLLRSEDSRITTGNQIPYWYNGATNTPSTTGDRYLRRSYSQLITLRNRTP